MADHRRVHWQVSASKHKLTITRRVREARNLSSWLNIVIVAIKILANSTYETKPQVKVMIGDYPAVCKNLDCNYHYVEPAGEVTGFTYSSGNRELVLTGTDLPMNSSMVRHV
jgi:hypothetical protein